MPKRVLITGARAAASLDVARDFAAAGWQVHLADSTRVRMARWSRLAAHHHYYPPPRQQSAAFRACIKELVERHDIALVVPTCEEVFHLAAPQLRQALGEKLFAPDLGTLRGLHDKLAFAKACAEWGLPAPESHGVEDPEALQRFASTSHEWVFKPRFSRFGESAVVGPDPAALARIDATPAGPWLAQRRIRGEEVCLHAVAHNGRLVAFTTYASQWKLKGGARYAFEPLAHERDQALRVIAEALAERANIHGQFACDVIFDAADKPYLIECNPRATSGVHLLAGQGDFARAIADGIAMAGRQQGPAYLAPAMWLLGFSRALRQGQLAQWRSLLSSGNDAISRTGDRAPLAGALIDALGFFLKSLRHNISTNAATTFDIEWNGEEMD